MHHIRRVTHELRELHRLTGPAGILLLASLITALLGFGLLGFGLLGHAQAHPAPAARSLAPSTSTSVTGSAPLTAWLPDTVAAGEVLHFVVELDGGAPPPLSAHLPGLSGARIPLTYAPETGLLRGAIPIPRAAPGGARFTLRLTGPDGHEWDWSLDLQARPTGGA